MVCWVQWFIIILPTDLLWAVIGYYYTHRSACYGDWLLVYPVIYPQYICRVPTSSSFLWNISIRFMQMDKMMLFCFHYCSSNVNNSVWDILKLSLSSLFYVKNFISLVNRKLVIAKVWPVSLKIPLKSLILNSESNFDFYFYLLYYVLSIPSKIWLEIHEYNF